MLAFLARGRAEPLKTSQFRKRRTSATPDATAAMSRSIAAMVALRSSKTRGACTTATLPNMGLFIPSLDDRLLRDLAAVEFDHRQAKHLGAVRIGTRLGKRQPASLGDACIHLVGDGAAANVVKERRDLRPSAQHARLARRIVAVDDVQPCIVGVEP